MGRAIESEPKLKDIFHAWDRKRKELITAERKMSVFPRQVIEEAELYDILVRRLETCKC